MRPSFLTSLSLIALVIVFMPVPARSEPEDLTKLRARFVAQTEIEKAPLNTLNRKFVGAMQRLLEQESQSGKLEHAVAVKKEIERFAEGKNFSEAAYRDGLSDDRGIRELQEMYLISRKKIESEIHSSQLRVLNIYSDQLAVLEKNYTKELKIDDALLIKDERREVAAKIEMLKNPGASPHDVQEMTLYIVAKGENEVFLNGKKLRCRNLWRDKEPDSELENDYTDGKSGSVEMAAGDIVTLQLRGEAVFRGAVIGCISEDKKKHIVFPSTAFRLIETGERVKPEKVDATEFAKKASEVVRKSQPDGDMAALWREHEIEGSDFIQPPEKGVWAVISAVITEEMFVDAEPETE